MKFLPVTQHHNERKHCEAKSWKELIGAL